MDFKLCWPIWIRRERSKWGSFLLTLRVPQGRKKERGYESRTSPSDRESFFSPSIVAHIPEPPELSLPGKSTGEKWQIQDWWDRKSLANVSFPLAPPPACIVNMPSERGAFPLHILFIPVQQRLPSPKNEQDHFPGAFSAPEQTSKDFFAPSSLRTAILFAE